MISLMDIRYSSKCPHCNADLYKYIWNKENIISYTDRFDSFDVDGFKFYRYVYYICPHCNNKFRTKVRANDSIFNKD